MPSPSLATLLTQKTQKQFLLQIVSALGNPGLGLNGQVLPALPASAWNAMDGMTYEISTESAILADLSATQVVIAASGYFQLAALYVYTDSTGTFPAPTPAQIGTSPYVDVIGQQTFNELRFQPTTTTGVASLSANASSGPYTVAAGQLTFQDTQGHLFTNTSSGSVPRNGTLALTWEATAPGSAWNLVIGQSVSLITPLPGVTLALGVGSAPTQWITSAGNDIESDQSYIARCLNKWTALGTGSPPGAWINWCFQASPEVRYAKTFPTGLGGVQVCVWGGNANVGATGLRSIRDFLATRIPNGSYVNANAVYNATAISINPDGGAANFAATVYLPASAQSGALVAITNALNTLVQTTPIGGYPLEAGNPSPTNGISNSMFVETITDAVKGITKVLVMVHNVPPNEPGTMVDANPLEGNDDLGQDFLMPFAGGNPTVAQSPPPISVDLLNPWNLSLVTVV